jgi:hypothetical protein
MAETPRDHWVYGGPLGFGHWVTSADGRQICVVYGAGTNPNSERDLRLIVAAPRLLARCRAAFHALRSYQYDNASADLAEAVANDLEVLIKEIGHG